MLNIEFLVSLFVTAIIVYFIRKKLNLKKANQVAAMRQKDIKRKRKQEQRSLNKQV